VTRVFECSMIAGRKISDHVALLLLAAMQRRIDVDGLTLRLTNITVEPANLGQQTVTLCGETTEIAGDLSVEEFRQLRVRKVTPK
jgi:hypothetical protein